MGFIKITEEKNPVEMHNKVFEASKNNELTPEFCMEVLSHTNVPVIMGKMLEEIGKLPIEEQSQYIEVILSMFDGRQTSEKVRNKALEIADNLGFENELNDVIERTGDWGYPARVGCDKIYVIDKGGDYRDVDFSAYERVIVKGEIEEKIIFNSYFNTKSRNHILSGILDLRGAKNVDLRGCDLSKVTKIIFEEGASVSLSEAKNLPKDLDVSMYDEVSLNGCDLKGIKLKFNEGAEVYLAGAKNLPTNLDVSMCECVLFSVRTVFGVRYADISNVKELKFKNEEQMKDSQVKIPEGWKGKIIYTDDEKKKNDVKEQEENVSVWNKFKNMFGMDR